MVWCPPPPRASIITCTFIPPRLRAEKFLSPRQAYNQGGWETVGQDTREKSALLNALGIRLNLAPVADLSDDPQDFIYSRSFGGDAGQVAQFVRQVVGWARQEGVASALKHFPGYGSNMDTHTGLSWDSRARRIAAFLEGRLSLLR